MGTKSMFIFLTCGVCIHDSSQSLFCCDDYSEAPSMDNFSDRISFLVSQIEMIMDTVW